MDCRWLVVGALVVAGVAGCASAGASATADSVATPLQGTTPLPTAATESPTNLNGLTWLAEGPQGVSAGVIGGPSIALPSDEVPITAQGRWVLSAKASDVSWVLIIREFGSPEIRIVDLGARSPGSVAIAGDAAFVGGLSTEGPADPGLLRVDLPSGQATLVISPTDTEGSRYVVASRDASVVLTTLCPPDYADRCDADVVDPGSGEVRPIGSVDGGLPRAAGGGWAVLTPVTESAPTEVFAVRLDDGGTAWKDAGREFGAGYVTTKGILIQARLEVGDSEVLRVEAVDLASGAVRTIFSESAEDRLPGLWPEFSTDDAVVVGDWASLEVALRKAGPFALPATLIHLDGLLSEPISISLGRAT